MDIDMEMMSVPLETGFKMQVLRQQYIGLLCMA